MRKKKAEMVLQAMEMIENGSSINATSKATGICNQTLRRYWWQYKENGVNALFDKRSYPLQFKQKIAEESEAKGVSIVAFDYSIPSKTIRGWMEQSKNNPAGILDKRKKEERNLETTHSQALISNNINATINRLSISNTSTARAITKTLVELRPFQNPAFNSMYIHLQDICQLVYKDKGYSQKEHPVLDDNDASLIAVTARTIWSFNQFDYAQRSEAEAWLELTAIQLFMLYYIDTAFKRIAENAYEFS